MHTYYDVVTGLSIILTSSRIHRIHSR